MREARGGGEGSERSPHVLRRGGGALLNPLPPQGTPFGRNGLSDLRVRTRTESLRCAGKHARFRRVVGWLHGWDPKKRQHHLLRTLITHVPDVLASRASGLKIY